MKQTDYKKIEKFLYHLYEPEVLKDELRDYYISNMNLSKTTWLKGYNTMENQVINMLDSKRMKDIELWQVFLKKTLVFLKEEKYLYYQFIKYKYFDLKSFDEIKNAMNLNEKQFHKLKQAIICFIYEKAVGEGLIEEKKV